MDLSSPINGGGDGGGREAAVGEVALAFKFVARYRKHIPKRIKSILVDADASVIFAQIEGQVASGYAEDEALDVSIEAVRAATAQLVIGAFEVALARSKALQTVYLKQIAMFERKGMIEYVLDAHTAFEFNNSNNLHAQHLKRVKDRLAKPADHDFNEWLRRIEAAQRAIDKVLEETRELGKNVSSNRKVLDDTKRLTFQKIALIAVAFAFLTFLMTSIRFYWDCQDRAARSAAATAPIQSPPMRR